MATLLHIQVSEFRGKYPEIPLPEGFDRESLSPDAFFVTLPIGKVGARSRNERTYLESAVRALVDQVNSDKPRGWWGHPEHEERTQIPPALQWVGAILAEDGMAWGKALVLTADAREFFRAAKAANREVGSSIYGEATMQGDQVVDVALSYIDLIAEPNWVGVPETATEPPHITSETTIVEDKMSETNNELIAELREQRDAANKRIAELTAEIGEHKSKAAEAATRESAAIAKAAEAETKLAAALEKAGEVEAIRSLLARESYISLSLNINGNSMMEVIEELLEELLALKATQVASSLDAVITDMVKVPDVRPLVLELLGGKPEVDKTKIKHAGVSETYAAGVREKVTAILSRPYIQTLLKGAATIKAGPSAVIGETSKSAGALDRDQIAAEAKKIAREMGTVTG
jgi:hypothetical protein